MSTKKLVQGAFILTSASVITRLIGFFYRIFMSNAIGAEGMGLYQLIMPIYMLVWSISSSGISTAISKITSEECEKRRNCFKTLVSSALFSSCAAAFLSIVVFIFSDIIAEKFLGDTRCSPLLKILSLCFPFMACASCIRGYFYGLQKHIYPACAQVFEQIIRVAVVFMLYPFFFSKGMEYACAAAVTGVAIGEMLSFLLTLIFLKHTKPPFKATSSAGISIANVIAIALPLTLTRISASLLSAVENVLIPSRLSLFSSSVNSLSLFGSLTGMAMPLIQFPSSVLVAVSSSLMPAISSASVSGNKNSVEKAVEKSLSFTSAVSFMAFSFFFAFSQEICIAVYHNASLGVLLKKLSLLCPLLYTNITLCGILNGLGMHNFIFLISLVSSLINIAAIYFLMPVIGIDAFIISTFTGLLWCCTMGISKCIRKENLIHILLNKFFMPFCCAFCSINISIFTRQHFNLSFIPSLFIMGITYTMLIIFSGAAEIKNDMLSIIKNKRMH
ncbi:MAG: oligosaccharide flippase family protein [Firmicutes bacterium]|nr:oligosaccharide flippase family protein [Bacillota bacterium]